MICCDIFLWIICVCGALGCLVLTAALIVWVFEWWKIWKGP